MSVPKTVANPLRVKLASAQTPPVLVSDKKKPLFTPKTPLISLDEPVKPKTNKRQRRDVVDMLAEEASELTSRIPDLTVKDALSRVIEILIHNAKVQEENSRVLMENNRALKTLLERTAPQQPEQLQQPQPQQPQRQQPQQQQPQRQQPQPKQQKQPQPLQFHPATTPKTSGTQGGHHRDCATSSPGRSARSTTGDPCVKSSHKEADSEPSATTAPQDCCPAIQSHGSKNQGECNRMEDDSQGETDRPDHNPLPVPQYGGDCGPPRTGTTNEGFLCNGGQNTGGSQPVRETGWEEGEAHRRVPAEADQDSYPDAQVRKNDDRSKVHPSDDRGWNPASIKRETGDRSRTPEGHQGEEDEHRKTCITLKPRRPANVTVATINVRHFNDAKSAKVRKLIEKHSVDLAILTETSQTVHRPLVGKGKPFMVVGQGDASSGVAVVFESDKVDGPQLQKTRILQILLPNGVNVVGGYGPTEQAPGYEKIKFWSEIKAIVEASTQQHAATIFIGDLNAGHEKQIGGKREDGPSNYERLQEAIQLSNLKIVPSPPTWKSARSTRPTRTLDRCLVQSRGDFTAESFLDWEDNLSDHAVLITKVILCDIDRNKGRPYHKPQLPRSSMEYLWDAAKQRLKQLPQQQQNGNDENPLRRFWKALHDDEMSTRQPLTITDDQDNPLGPEEAVESCASYLRTVWSEADPYTVHYTANSIRSQPPTLEEVEIAVKEIKKDTALGRDKIQATLVKESSEAANIYTDLFKALWNTPETVPREWKDMRVKPILKKNPRTTPQGARPVTCLATSAKILNRILAERNKFTYEMVVHDAQHAYRSGRSHWTALGELVSQVASRGKCSVTFLDMSKAFDRVSRVALERALHRWGLPRNEAELIIAQYDGCEVFVELNGKAARPFNHTNGIRQGCTLSGILWNLVMAEVHEKVEEILPNGKHALISYADDLIIIGKTKIETQVVKRAIKEALLEANLILNDQKEATQQFDVDGAPHPVEWLGVILTTNLTWEEEAASRVKKAKQASDTVKRVCRTNSIRIATKPMINVLQAMVATHVTTGRHVVKFDSDQARRLQNALMEAILDNTNLSAAAALGAAEAIWNGTDFELSEEEAQATESESSNQDAGTLPIDLTTRETKKKKVVRKIPQSKISANILGTEIYLAPTQQQIRERQKVINQKSDNEEPSSNEEPQPRTRRRTSGGLYDLPPQAEQQRLLKAPVHRPSEDSGLHKVLILRQPLQQVCHPEP
ncbi:uncharacterized protein LOC129617808 [Condylostylus longicornis]|uniref:uncharacterized protein LOC129617808 n=1 Tax=Condylostylus longicornis TaxID=2530218 RepID=UPI00244E3F1D|nr:uncharacterized protein LOC129617808 [Condylostylus longicornis]